MLTRERQEKIYAMLTSSGAVTTSYLTEQFDVSIETIRRDLLAMEKRGMLTRVHGGAVTKSNMKPFLTLSERNMEFAKEKRTIAKKAIEFISNGDIIGIDTGSTAIVLAEVLKEHFSSLTIITHSLDVFNILHNHANFSVILCGGQYLKEENSFYGTLTCNMLNSLHMQKSFICPWAISLSHGICDYNDLLLNVQKEFIKSSGEIFVLADNSKFEKKALIKGFDMNPDYNYITDSGLSDEIKNLYIENGINIYMG